MSSTYADNKYEAGRCALLVWLNMKSFTSRMVAPDLDEQPPYRIASDILHRKRGNESEPLVYLKRYGSMNQYVQPARIL